MIEIGKSWSSSLPEACVGLLVVREVQNQVSTPELEQAQMTLAEMLREKYAGADRKTLRDKPVFAAYNRFYKRFRKTYHVQLQLESVIFKEKPIRSPSSLVACMFLAELRTGLLTAGHDCRYIKFPLAAEIADGGESYQRLNGSHQELKTGDLYIRDQEGILSSIIYGPDQRTRIRKDTTRVAYTTYGVPGISSEKVRVELEILERYLLDLNPDAAREWMSVV